SEQVSRMRTIEWRRGNGERFFLVLAVCDVDRLVDQLLELLLNAIGEMRFIQFRFDAHRSVTPNDGCDRPPDAALPGRAASSGDRGLENDLVLDHFFRGRLRDRLRVDRRTAHGAVL